MASGDADRIGADCGVKLLSNQKCIHSSDRRLESADPWGETADQLDSIAASFPELGWEGQAVEAQQLIRYLNPEAAKQIGDLTEKHSLIGSQDFPGARDRIIGIIRGAATAARRHGQLKTDDAPRNVVNVQQTQTVRQEQQALVLVTVEDVLAWDDLPGELKPALDAMAAAKDRGDRAGFMRSASDFASKAEAFPSFLAKLGDAWDWISGLV